ncbi:MAG TPA: hypothetical protein PKL14_07705 [Holophaga sp.]|nr:hypothetical protein [Holophaga sp.]
MQILLSHFGQRWCQHQLNVLAPGAQPAVLDPREWQLLLELMCGRAILFENRAPEAEVLLTQGLVDDSALALDPEALKLRMKRNPLEHVRWVVIEYTTACDLHCRHCRNLGRPSLTESQPERLAAAAVPFLELGIRRFDFIGGEVIQHGVGWLDVVRSIHRSAEGLLVDASGNTLSIGVMTSGWFLGRKNFAAAGRSYVDDRALMEHLLEAGVTHLVFSLDGPAPLHDAWRGIPRLFGRILDGIRSAQRVGLRAQVSILNPSILAKPASLAWLREVSQALYGWPDPVRDGECDDAEALRSRLSADEHNYVSNLIDVGGAARFREGRIFVREIADAVLRCKNFFRPAPSLYLNASGELATCPLMGDAPGYGNFHDTGMRDILNHIHEAPLFRLHAEHRLPEYRRFLDLGLLGERVDHVCTLRVALTRLALEIESGRLDPGNARDLREANRKSIGPWLSANAAS